MNSGESASHLGFLNYAITGHAALGGRNVWLGHACRNSFCRRLRSRLKRRSLEGNLFDSHRDFPDPYNRFCSNLRQAGGVQFGRVDASDCGYGSVPGRSLRAMTSLLLPRQLRERICPNSSDISPKLDKAGTKRKNEKPFRFRPLKASTGWHLGLSIATNFLTESVKSQVTRDQFPMRMACLILGYRAASVLKFVVPFHRAAGWDVFVHVDPKVDQAAYKAELGDSAMLCHFIGVPVDVFSGGSSIIEAEIKLIKAAQKAGRYDKYLLLY